MLWKTIFVIAIFFSGYIAQCGEDALSHAIKLYEKKQYRPALQILDSLIAFDPNDVEAINNRGLNKFALGDKAAAFSDYAKVLSINPRHAKAINNRGYVKFSEGDTKAAIEDYELALSIAPDLPKAYNNRGVARFSIGDTVGAIKDYDKAVSLNPKLAEAYVNRGTAYYRTHNIIFARRDYDNAIMIDNDYAEAYFGRGLAEYAAGDKINACSDWNTAFALGYTNETETVNRICLPDHADEVAELNPADFSWISRLRILTETGKWEIKKEYLEVIGKVAATLKAYPTMRIGINGYADSINRSNDADLNRKLSQKRAEAVRSIIAGLGISLNRMTATGFGEANPAATNTTEEGRKQNRRIEFILIHSTIGIR